MSATVLRDGATVTEDRRLDLIPKVDPRGLANYPVAELLRSPAPPRGRSWAAGPVLDQGREGACVGFACVGELAAEPGPRHGRDPATLDLLARRVYRRATELDEWPETTPTSDLGTSLTAGGAAMVELGLADEYRWGAGVDELARVLTRTKADAKATATTFGPAVAAVEWRDGMYEAAEARGWGPRRAMLRTDGRLVGYHAILVRGYVAKAKRYGLPGRAYLLRNSWGAGYGIDGDALIDEDELAAVLVELMVPVTRL